jgi:hypothetical protein
MKMLLTFQEFLNESKLNESMDISPLSEWANNYVSELVDLGENQNKSKSFVNAIVKIAEDYFKVKSNGLVVDYENLDFDEKSAKEVATVEGKKYGFDVETVDYVLIESDKSGNLWMTSFDIQRGDATCIRKK